MSGTTYVQVAPPAKVDHAGKTPRHGGGTMMAAPHRRQGLPRGTLRAASV